MSTALATALAKAIPVVERRSRQRSGKRRICAFCHQTFTSPHQRHVHAKDCTQQYNSAPLIRGMRRLPL